MKPVTIHFVPNKETPGTVQYKEVTAKGLPKKAETLVSRSLYISKRVIGEDPAEWPTLLTVTIEAK
jgi:hypothetical protein